MANFNEAYDITMGHEGGYVNDPDDAGGETYKGISRKYNPQWKGWSIIDSYKKIIEYPKMLDKSSELQNEVKNFYKENYWDVNRLDEIKNQNVANEIFDTGVNMGGKRAAKFLQEALNYLNRNQLLYDDLIVDGSVGSKTFNALNILLKNNEENIILKIMNVLQGMHYLNYMKENLTQEKYARGWFNRVIIYKKENNYVSI